MRIGFLMGLATTLGHLGVRGAPYAVVVLRVTARTQLGG